MVLSKCLSQEAKRKACHLLLVADMVGIEAFLAVTFIMMVANIQTLGVPVVYSSLPGVVSAVLCGIMMPGLGVITGKFATSKGAKAVVLMLANLFQITGALLVLLANTMQMLYYDEKSRAESSGNISVEVLESSTRAPQTMFILQNDTGTSTIDLNLNHNGSVSGQLLLNNVSYPSLLIEYSSSDSASKQILPDRDDGSFQLPGLMGIIGYALMDAGYDISNCFMKTFIMAVTPPEEHAEVIVKSIFVGSFGGCLITVVGSLGVGKWLTSGTDYDTNAMECAFLAGVCILVMLVAMSVSLVTGMLYKREDHDEDLTVSRPIVDEKTNLLMDSTRSTDFIKESLDKAWGFSHSSTHTLLEHSGIFPNRSRGLSGTHSILPRHVPKLEPIPQKKAPGGLLYRHRARIFLCLATFLSCGAHYSFNLFSVNFVGASIFQGNPSAPVESTEYTNYLEGMQAGSVGFILLYVSFVLAAMSQNYVLRRYGWWSETLVLSILYIGIHVNCAVSKVKLAYYAAAIANGCYRAFIFTVPYIVVEKIVKDQQNKGYTVKGTSSSDMVIIASMWPCGFALCAGVMGPLLDWTGNAATPIFYTVILSTLGTAMFWFIRKY